MMIQNRSAKSHRLMSGFSFVFWFAVALLVLVPAAAHARTRHNPCTPKFPLQLGQHDGWLGADAAYSIPLHDGRDVWIFGDTLYGKKRVINKSVPQMVRNSLGISTCKDGHWHLHYVIRKDAHGVPQSYFAPQHPHTWYWALDGFTHHHDLWVTLLCVQNEKNSKSNALGFGLCGTDLARISNLGRNPQKWTIHYFPLVPNGTGAYPSATALVHGKYAYIFAQWDKGTRPLLATRCLHHPSWGLGLQARLFTRFLKCSPTTPDTAKTPSATPVKSIRNSSTAATWSSPMPATAWTSAALHMTRIFTSPK